jgi:hypothetical protein
MKQTLTAGLQGRLESYSLSARSRGTAAVLRQRLGNWTAYAAVTGSAMAAATSASAGLITYSGGPVTVTAASNTSSKAAQIGSASIRILAKRLDFSTSLFQGHLGFAAATGARSNAASLRVGFLGAGQSIKKLGSGQVISSGAPGSGLGSFASGHIHLKLRSTGFSTVGGDFNRTDGRWTAGVPGFAGFAIPTNTYSSTARMNYGWVELEFNVDGSGFPDSITLLAGAFDNTPDEPVTTPGSPPTSTPEPGTAGLMLLALGAAGVTALRRRKAL